MILFLAYGRLLIQTQILDFSAGQMSALKGGSVATKPKRRKDEEDSDDESGTEEEEDSTSETNTDTEPES